jgi:hypothetical protein
MQAEADFFATMAPWSEEGPDLAGRLGVDKLRSALSEVRSQAASGAGSQAENAILCFYTEQRNGMWMIVPAVSAYGTTVFGPVMPSGFSKGVLPALQASCCLTCFIQVLVTRIMEELPAMQQHAAAKVADITRQLESLPPPPSEDPVYELQSILGTIAKRLHNDVRAVARASILMGARQHF